MRVDLGIELGPVDSGDMDQLRRWRNDYRVWKWCRQNSLISDVEQEGWFQRQSKDQTISMYKIIRRVDEQRSVIGVCGLTSIDWMNRRAEFSLYIDPERHGRGYGKEALKVLFTHGFQNFGLHQIWGESFDGNPAIKMFKDLGMTHDGTRRQFYFKDGKFLDAHLFSILRDQWLTLYSPSSSPQSSSPPEPTPSSAA